MKKKILLCALSFLAVALFSCGIAFLPNWNPSPTTPPSDIGQEEGDIGQTTEAKDGNIGIRIYHNVYFGKSNSMYFYSGGEYLDYLGQVYFRAGITDSYDWVSITSDSDNTTSENTKIGGSSNTWGRSAKLQMTFDPYQASTSKAKLTSFYVKTSTSGYLDRVVPGGNEYSQNTLRSGVDLGIDPYGCTVYITIVVCWTGQPQDFEIIYMEGVTQSYTVSTTLNYGFPLHDVEFDGDTFGGNWASDYTAFEVIMALMNEIEPGFCFALSEHSNILAAYYGGNYSHTYYFKQDSPGSAFRSQVSEYVTGSVRLYACYPEFTMTFDKNGGSGGTNSIQVMYLTFLKNEIDVPTRTGYTFAGYTYQGELIYDASGKAIEKDDYYGLGLTGYYWNKTAKDTTLVAKWNAIPSTLTINPNGGTWNGSGSTRSFTQGYDSTKSVPNPTREGYTFTGWTKDGAGTLSGTTYTFALGDCTLTANWIINSYTLTVNPNGGTWNGSSSSQSFTQNYATTKSIPNPDAREGYTFTGWSRSGSGSLSGTTFTFGAGDCTLTANWSINSYSLSVDPNGGTWNGSSSVSSVSQNYATTKSLTAPSRTGYSLGAWVLDGGGSISTFGKLHSKSADPFFMDGTNSTYVYNNSYNGTVTHEYIAASNTDIELPTGARILRIKNAGTSSPGLGGFSNHLESYAKAVIYTIIYAKIPVGYNIYSAENAYGGGTKTWLTSQAGTGDWQVYIHRYNCGSSGSFSSVNYYYLSGTTGTASNPVVWDVAYFGTYDATGLSASGSSSTTPTFTYPASNSSIVALWNRSSVTVTINPDGGSYNGSTSNSSISAKYRDLVNLEVPTKTGYTFKGWQITSGSGTITNTQYLWEERSFDGVDDYIALGRDQMYTDKITVSVLAYMDNWAEYGANNDAMRIISCTEGGGWNIESSNGNIQVAMYDSGVGYKHVTTTKPWSSLSSGWHDFTFSFDGRNARLFIDDAQIACSAVYSSGKIGYYSNNVIFIGAEAGWTTTTPADGYFKGLIKSVVIINDYALGSYNVHDAGGYLIPQGNVTIKALWEETWAVNYTKPSGSGTASSPYQVDSASDLAYFAYKTQILGEQCYDHIVLTKDIDLAGYDWMPIGTGRNVVSGVQAYFRGVFDGQGHTISNLNINVSGIAKINEYGLFGLVDSGAVLKDFTILSGEVNGIANLTGAVAGYIWSATIDNVTNYANVTGSSYIGGIVGQMTRGTTISNCFNYGNVQGINYVGGVVGGMEDYTTTRTIVGVTNMGQVTGHSQVGGIIGRAYHVTVESAYNGYTASVTATTRYAGGVVGYLMNGSTVLKSVNTADVTGLECVAGLVGGAVNGGSLTTSYSEGLISARGSSVTEAGTLVGGVTDQNMCQRQSPIVM